MSTRQPVSRAARPRVLAFLADRERQLEVGDDDLGDAGVLVDADLAHLGRRECAHHELLRLAAVRDDVDLLAAQLVHDLADAHAARADARADGVDVLVVRGDRDLGAVAGLARDRLDLDDAVEQLRHLELEQTAHESGVRARHDDLRALGGLAHLDDVRLHARAVVVAVARNLLGLREQRLDPAQVEQGVAGVGLLDDARDDVALAPGVLLVLHLALGLTDPLQDHLLRGLRGDATEVGGGVVPLAGDVAFFVELLRDHADLAGLDVDLDERLLGRVGHPLVRGHERVRERLEHDLFGDALLDRERGKRFEHLGVLHDFPFARARLAALGVLDPGLLRGCGPHSKTVRACVTSAIAICSRAPSSDSTTQLAPSKSARTPRTRLRARVRVELDRDLLAEGRAVVLGPAQRTLDARAADLEQVRAADGRGVVDDRATPACVTSVIVSRSTPRRGSR